MTCANTYKERKRETTTFKDETLHLLSHTNILFFRSNQVVLSRFTWFGGTKDSSHQTSFDSSLQGGDCLHLHVCWLPVAPAFWRRRRCVHLNTTNECSFIVTKSLNSMFVLKGTLNIILIQVGLTGGRVFFWVSVQERRVGREGTYSKSLLSCELPAQGPTYHVVNCIVKHLHTHKSYFSLQSERSKPP